MAYVIAEPCIDVIGTACVDACPVDCIHPRRNEVSFEAERTLYIDPVECIDAAPVSQCVRFRPYSPSQTCPIAGRSMRRSIEVTMRESRTAIGVRSNKFVGIGAVEGPLQ